MIKVIDIDKLFDEYISDYVYKNVGKVKPEEIENNIPVLYEKFGNEKLKELDGKTPGEFYRGFSAAELLDCLKEHLNKGVSVSDFLCEAIIAAKDGAKAVTEAIKCDDSEEFVAYCMNMLSDMKAEIPVERYFEFALLDYPDCVGELATEFLCEIADKVKDGALARYADADERGGDDLATFDHVLIDISAKVGGVEIARKWNCCAMLSCSSLAVKGRKKPLGAYPKGVFIAPNL